MRMKRRQVYESNPLTNKTLSSLKIPPFDANVLSPLHKLWRRCQRLETDNSNTAFEFSFCVFSKLRSSFVAEWKSRSLAIQTIWVSATISTIIFNSILCLHSHHGPASKVDRSYQKLNHSLELTHQRVQSLDAGNHLPLLTHGCCGTKSCEDVGGFLNVFLVFL